MQKTLKIPEWMKESDGRRGGQGAATKEAGFIRKNLSALASLRGWISDSKESAERRGFLQLLDPSARIAGVLVLTAAASFAEDFFTLLTAAALLAVLAVLSGVGFSSIAKKVLPAFIFTLIIIIPVFFRFLSPGKAVTGFSLGGFDFFITESGLKTGVFFITRVTTMTSLVALLILTTREADFFIGLRRLPVPAVFVTTLFMTFRHIFILLRTAEDTSMARRSRTIDASRLKDHGGWFASRVALFLKKSLAAAEELNMAMVSRGFGGRLRVLGGSVMRGRDYLWIGAVTFLFLISLMV
ncbi:MAG: cobalt ECF transporter T component CbiQ [Thermodesulfobacteriota bacterium]